MFVIKNTVTSEYSNGSPSYPSWVNTTKDARYLSKVENARKHVARIGKMAKRMLHRPGFNICTSATVEIVELVLTESGVAYKV